MSWLRNSRLRNPWLGAVVAVAALGIQARAESPLAALAIGLPFAVLMWAYWCLFPRLAASLDAPQDVMVTPPKQLVPKSIGIGIIIVILVLMVAWFAYMCYGLVTGRGVIGWLNAVQAANDGRFSTKLSFIVALLYLFCAMGAIALAATWLGRGSDTQTPIRNQNATSNSAPAGAPEVRNAVSAQDEASAVRSGTRLALWMSFGIAVAAWVIGYPIYLWIAAEHREDVQAHYASVDLGGPGVSWPPEPHVSLNGVPLGDQVLVLTEGNHSKKTYFIPMTGRGWTSAQPVNAVLTFEADYPPQLDRPVLGRLRSDALPPAAVQAFARLGVTIDASHRLIDMVPSDQGQVADRSESDHQMFLIGATMISVMSLVGSLMVWLMVKIKHRRAGGRSALNKPAQ